jgi:hypothetical protein
MKFGEMIGQNVFAVVPFIHATKLQTLKIHGAEAGGIWVECQALTDLLLKAVGAQVAPKTPIFFLPFQQLLFAGSSIDQPSLSEKGLGL